jgi:hypothetical protein
MGVPEATAFPSREDTSQVDRLHDLAKIRATSDDPDLVSRAGLVPAMALACRVGLVVRVEEAISDDASQPIRHAVVSTVTLRRFRS